MKYVKPKKLKVLIGLFFGTGIPGIAIGLLSDTFYITMLGTINLILGGVVGWIFLTQGPKIKDSRKK